MRETSKRMNVDLDSGWAVWEKDRENVWVMRIVRIAMV